MSLWGRWLLANCDSSLTVDLSSCWFFPSELREIRNRAWQIGVKVSGNPRNRGTCQGERLA